MLPRATGPKSRPWPTEVPGLPLMKEKDSGAMSSAQSSSPVSSLLMLTNGEAMELWLTTQLKPEKSSSSNAWEVDLVPL